MTKKRFIYILILLLSCQFPLLAQVYNPTDPMDPMYDPNDPMNAYRNPQAPNDSLEIVSLPPQIYMWKISETLGNIIPVDVDTVHIQFQNSNLTEGMSGHYNYLGNLGAPRLSRIFFDRKPFSSSMFLAPLDEFATEPHDFLFTNSNIPYANISYYKTFDKQYGEERLKTYFSVNVNKELAFGFNFDYLYGRGYYQNQSTSYLKGGIFGSYIADKYRAHIIYNMYNMKMKENGGITDDRYITDPEVMAGGRKEYEAQNIPTVLSNTWNYNKNFHIYLTHRYNMGFYREIPRAENDTIPPAENDTIIKEEFVPVTSFIHTAKVERSRHRFISNDNIENYFDNNYMDPDVASANDSTTYFGVRNTFGIALLEGFNKYAKAGLTAYLSHKISKYTLMTDDATRTQSYNENELYVGGELLKRQGQTLHYKAIGEIGVAGKATGQFKVDGDFDLNFKLWNDTVSFIARASISNTLPAFYMRHYHSKHFQWHHDDMDKEFRTRLEGEINIERWKTNIRAGVENIKNYTYFNDKSLPSQSGDNIQVLSAQLKQNFKLGILHLDNEVVWQKSSNEEVLPLPDLSLYHNLYIATKLAKYKPTGEKVLSLQLGVDVRYFTKYAAPAYSPGIQQFKLQAEEGKIDIGGYPIVNVYANLNLKRTRFFVMMYHVNKGISEPNYFLAPHYPINQRMLKFGLSWNFYD
ncbi:putative porin [Bacteroides sp. 224]|uniref:putative porin n=1 Tax=Bacteroides sp. 224 TaxID=2302936 RepID=UPI0013D3E9CB|nr:putative porin [Bacteroides sp. 224]NDV65879.1 hypothetical protein [Bacteroides sp. 224]